MTQNKRKKVRKYRGSKTHGGGSMKKRRGAGHRGGRGRAGSGKRGDARKPSFWKTWKMGGTGFVNPNGADTTAINIVDLEKRLDTFAADGHATESSGAWNVDLEAAGYDKLLGTGRATKKLVVSVPEASKGAVSKVEDAGGSVTVTREKKVKAKKQKKAKAPADADDEPSEDDE